MSLPIFDASGVPRINTSKRHAITGNVGQHLPRWRTRHFQSPARRGGGKILLAAAEFTDQASLSAELERALLPIPFFLVGGEAHHPMVAKIKYYGERVA